MELLNVVKAHPLCFACLLLVSCSNAGEEKFSTDPPIGNKNVIISSLISNSNHNYRLTFAECSNNECAVNLQNLIDDKVVSQISLPWPASNTTFYEYDVDRWYGMGDPLSQEYVKAWFLGDSENDSLAVGIQIIELDDDTKGLLVSQTAGFEHVKQNHQLIAEKNNKLDIIWEYTEPQGPYWSNVVVAKEEKGSFTLIEGFSNANSNVEDSLEVRRFSWDSSASKLVNQENADTKVVVTGPFENAGAARSEIFNKPECYGANFNVLNGNVFGLSQFWIAAATTHTDYATYMKDSITDCNKTYTTKIADYSK